MKIYFILTILMSGLTKSNTKFWFVNNRDLALKDMSKSCVDNQQLDIFLPNGMGIADSIAITITNQYGVRNCSFVIHEDKFDNHTVKVIVIELIHKSEVVQSACEDTRLYLIDSSCNYTVNICQKLIENHLKPFVYRTRFMVRFIVEDTNNGRFKSMKITTSSSRKLKINEICNLTSEIKCFFNNSYTCISRELCCDQNINCGQYNLYDEDQHLCRKDKNEQLWVRILVGVFMSLFALYSVVCKVQRCLPFCRTYITPSSKKEEDTIVLTTQYLPAAKAYISMKEAKASKTKTMSERVKSHDYIDVTQTHLLNVDNQRQRRILHPKYPIRNEFQERNVND